MQPHINDILLKFNKNLTFKSVNNTSNMIALTLRERLTETLIETNIDRCLHGQPYGIMANMNAFST